MYDAYNLILNFKVIMILEFFNLGHQMDIQEIWEHNLPLFVLKSLERLIETCGLGFRALLTKKTHNKIWHNDNTKTRILKKDVHPYVPIQEI